MEKDKLFVTFSWVNWLSKWEKNRSLPYNIPQNEFQIAYFTKKDLKLFEENIINSHQSKERFLKQHTKCTNKKKD